MYRVSCIVYRTVMPTIYRFNLSIDQQLSNYRGIWLIRVAPRVNADYLLLENNVVQDARIVILLSPSVDIKSIAQARTRVRSSRQVRFTFGLRYSFTLSPRKVSPRSTSTFFLVIFYVTDLYKVSYHTIDSRN